MDTSAAHRLLLSCLLQATPLCVTEADSPHKPSAFWDPTEGQLPDLDLEELT